MDDNFAKGCQKKVGKALKLLLGGGGGGSTRKRIAHFSVGGGSHRDDDSMVWRGVRVVADVGGSGGGFWVNGIRPTCGMG